MTEILSAVPSRLLGRRRTAFSASTSRAITCSPVAAAQAMKLAWWTVGQLRLNPAAVVKVWRLASSPISTGVVPVASKVTEVSTTRGPSSLSSSGGGPDVLYPSSPR